MLAIRLYISSNLNANLFCIVMFTFVCVMFVYVYSVLSKEICIQNRKFIFNLSEEMPSMNYKINKFLCKLLSQPFSVLANILWSVANFCIVRCNASQLSIVVFCGSSIAYARSNRLCIVATICNFMIRMKRGVCCPLWFWSYSINMCVNDVPGFFYMSICFMFTDYNLKPYFNNLHAWHITAFINE